MALPPAPLLLLLLATVALRESCLGFSSHSMEFLSTSISQPSPGQPRYIALWRVDNLVIAHYDSNSRKMQPRVSWMEKVETEYWVNETQKQRDNEVFFGKYQEVLRIHYNQNEGLHTIQWMFGCELRGDRSKGGFLKYGYDGRTFITFDKEALTWVAPDPQAKLTQAEWDALPGHNQKWKSYLEEGCIDWLNRYLLYGQKTLLRTESPVVTMSRRTEVENGMEMHVCQIHGFYPKTIDASWRRDGEVWLQDTIHGSVAPNADGTYHYWLGIQIDPKERGRYRCHVEHNSLWEPLEMALKAPGSNKSLIIGCIMAALVLVCGIVGVWAFLKKHRNDYRTASTSDKIYSNLLQGNNQVI